MIKKIEDPEDAEGGPEKVPSTSKQVLRLPSITELPLTARDIEDNSDLDSSSGGRNSAQRRNAFKKSDSNKTDPDPPSSAEMTDDGLSIDGRETSMSSENEDLKNNYLKNQSKRYKAVRFLLHEDDEEEDDEEEDSFITKASYNSAELPPIGNAADNYIEGCTEDLITQFIEEVMDGGPFT